MGLKRDKAGAIGRPTPWDPRTEITGENLSQTLMGLLGLEIYPTYCRKTKVFNKAKRHWIIIALWGSSFIGMLNLHIKDSSQLNLQ